MGKKGKRGKPGSPRDGKSTLSLTLFKHQENFYSEQDEIFAGQQDALEEIEVVTDNRETTFDFESDFQNCEQQESEPEDVAIPLSSSSENDEEGLGELVQFPPTPPKKLGLADDLARHLKVWGEYLYAKKKFDQGLGEKPTSPVIEMRM